MQLTINVDALDKSQAAVVSAADHTLVEDFEWLTLGNQEPLVLSFCDDAGDIPAWVTDASTSLAVGLGCPDIEGAQLYCSTTAFQISGSTRVGTLQLNTTALREALYRALQGVPSHRAPIALFTLEIRKASMAGAVETLALLPVFVANRVLPTSTPANAGASPYGIVPEPSISSLTGGGATALDGIDDSTLPTGYTVLLSYGRIPQVFQIFAGTDPTDVSATPVTVRVKNYGPSNQRVWVQLW